MTKSCFFSSTGGAGGGELGAGGCGVALVAWGGGGGVGMTAGGEFGTSADPQPTSMERKRARFTIEE